ncbi:MAG: hypothetical protein JWL62_3084 [Hyphomicrobiales bacterium]|nr:hypothetical protein [Hyphomicrobiales bacterium]
MAELSDRDKKALLGGLHLERDLPGLVEDLDVGAYVRDRSAALKIRRFYARVCVLLGLMLIGASFFIQAPAVGRIELRMGAVLLLAGLAWVWMVRRSMVKLKSFG